MRGHKMRTWRKGHWTRHIEILQTSYVTCDKYCAAQQGWIPWFALGGLWKAPYMVRMDVISFEAD